MVLDHGVVRPGGQVLQLLFGVGSDGPTPGLKEAAQVHPHSLGDGLGVQVHLPVVVPGEAAHAVVGPEGLLQGLPAEPLLHLRGGRRRRRSRVQASASLTELALNS